MKPVQFVLFVVISAAVCTALVRLLPPQTSRSVRESTYDRVIRTGVLRCGYGLWDPMVMRDPNTGQMSGIVYDFMQEVGRALKVKVEYTDEMPWDSIGAALNTGKIDAHCAGVWATPERGRAMAFSDPLFFSPTVAFARIDDDRFENNPAAMNSSNVTIGLSDDDITTQIYESDTPTAKKFTLPQMAPPEELLLAVMNGKADVAFNTPGRLDSFAKGYPGKIKIVAASRPLRIYPDTIAVNMDDGALLHMLNTSIDRLIENGAMDKLVAQYSKQFNVSYVVPVAAPYVWKRDDPSMLKSD